MNEIVTLIEVNKLQIGEVKLPNRVFLAPMAGVTDQAFRLIAREFGCGLVYTEMISAQALFYQNKKTEALLNLKGEIPPLAVQLFGCKPEIMARGAVEAVKAGAQIIDLNFGCPVPKIVKNGEGAALLTKPELAVQIVQAIRQAVSVPVTVKMRTGWSQAEIIAVPFAQMMEDAGVAALTVHGRTRDQYYNGSADWGIIREVNQVVAIPVIGNGDLWTPQDARKMLAETGCQAVMLARGVCGNPWLIKQTRSLLEQKKEIAPPGPKEKIDGALRHLALAVQLKGEAQGVREMRQHLAWYLKGLPHVATVKAKLFRLTEEAAVQELLLDYQQTKLNKVSGGG